jgi:hypothetical protein
MVQSLNRDSTADVHFNRCRNGRMPMVAATLAQKGLAKLQPKEQG